MVQQTAMNRVELAKNTHTHADLVRNLITKSETLLTYTGNLMAEVPRILQVGEDRVKSPVLKTSKMENWLWFGTAHP